MVEQQHDAETAMAIRALLAAHDDHWRDAARIRERLHGELYRREREQHPEWVDLGGEA